MHKIVIKYLVLPASLKSIYLRLAVVLLNLFLLTTTGVICTSAQTKNVNQSAEDDLPALQRKVKKSLIKVQNNLIYGNNTAAQTEAALAFDNLYAYIATPSGLFRTAKSITAQSSFELIGFQNAVITNLYVHNNTLYVLKRSKETPGTRATDHSFLRSEDHGATFIPMDAALEYCLGGYCPFLSPTEAIFKDNLIFLNAGGAPNLQVSNNNGTSWIPLLGSLAANACYDQSFEIINNRVLVGGECPLDIAYIRGGTLRPDLLGWASQEQRPTNVVTPNLGNRNVHFIKNKPNTADVYTGVEGALLKSTDLGQSFRFVIKYSLANNLGSYPYIEHILFHSKNPNVIVVGGFDKGSLRRLFLAYSKDNGETWTDISSQTQFWVGEPSNTTEVDKVQFISEDSEGRVLVGITHPQTKTLTIVQLRVDVAALR
jgi:hypothetical protein